MQHWVVICEIQAGEINRQAPLQIFYSKHDRNLVDFSCRCKPPTRGESKMIQIERDVEHSMMCGWV